ncbi:MAG: ABC transporter ATP-binding protein [Thermoplasmatales archaeon]|nr:ABC transporter ATP-binding protein [Candidatus Thermoplasmatota archaeon]MDA8054480.1 ABC transporter ATP-binding protein [Thermoplasmatales archaeon]
MTQSDNSPGRSNQEYLLIAKNIKKYFPIKMSSKVMTHRIPLKAVDDVSLIIKRGEVIGLVGESGCGKTTLGKLLINLISPSEGYLVFNPSEELVKDLGKDESVEEKEFRDASMYNLNKRKMRQLRRKMQIVFQDPYSSLDPRYLIKDIIAEPLLSFGIRKDEAYSRSSNLLREVGLSDDFVNRYPHQLSGGQRQRVAIARALALNPEFMVLDEPTSALDVSVQAQVLNLLENLRKKHNLTILFITHNMIVARHICNRIYVMYLGKIVEEARTEDLFAKPMHPYTVALLSSVPIPNPKTKRSRVILEGDVPSPITKPRGCSFHTRCKFAFEKCGWTSGEIVESMNYILDPTRNTVLETLPALSVMEVIDENRLKISYFGSLSQEQGETIKEVINKERREGKIRSLFGISSISLENGSILINVFESIRDPVLLTSDIEHLVACWLYEEKNSSAGSIIERA